MTGTGPCARAADPSTGPAVNTERKERRPMEGARSKNVFYANVIAINAIPTDFVIYFGFNTPALKDGNAGGDEGLYVHLSPVAAKILANALSAAVARYETTVGVLPDLKPETAADSPGAALQ